MLTTSASLAERVVKANEVSRNLDGETAESALSLTPRQLFDIAVQAKSLGKVRHSCCLCLALPCGRCD